MWQYPDWHGLPLSALSGALPHYASWLVCQLDWQWITLWKCLWKALWISSGEKPLLWVLQAELNAMALHHHHRPHHAHSSSQGTPSIVSRRLTGTRRPGRVPRVRVKTHAVCSVLIRVRATAVRCAACLTSVLCPLPIRVQVHSICGSGRCGSWVPACLLGRLDLMPGLSAVAAAFAGVAWCTPSAGTREMRAQGKPPAATARFGHAH
jgi:hypothetical protein